MSTCSIEEFPFVYFDSDGELVNGTLVGDSCIFSDANCNPDSPTRECCEVNEEVYPGDEMELMFLVICIMFLPNIWAKRKMMKSMSTEEKEVVQMENDARLPWFITQREWLSDGFKKKALWLYALGFKAFVVVEIIVGIYLKLSLQEHLSVTERNGLAASEAFMTPFYSIFNFVEDIIMIHVSYSMAQGNKQLTDRLMHIGLAGVTVSGILAGLVGTLLGVFEKTLSALTNPGMANDNALYEGCSFIESIDLARIIPYWMMLSWGCMGIQFTGVMTGFFMGAYEFHIMGWIGMIGWGVFSLIWFGNNLTFGNPLTLLGIASITKDWLTPLLFLGFLLSPMGMQIRERTGLDLSVKKVISYLLIPFQKKESTAGSNSDDAKESKRKEEVSDLVKEGLKLMFIEVTLQACMSCSMYLALRADSAVAYQITALQSEMPVYGEAWAIGLSIIVKMHGPVLLSEGMPSVFVGFVKLTLVATLLLSALIFGTTIPSLDALALESGTNACEYATSSECLPYFESVFGENGEGGIYTLAFTFSMFPVASTLECTLMVLRAILLVCMDFDFLVKATIVGGISYIPAIAVVQYASVGFRQEAIAYFAAVYVPQAVIVFLCLIRLVSVLRKIGNGEEGPWSPKLEKRMERMNSIRESKAFHKKAIATAEATFAK